MQLLTLIQNINIYQTFLFLIVTYINILHKVNILFETPLSKASTADCQCDHRYLFLKYGILNMFYSRPTGQFGFSSSIRIIETCIEVF